MLLRQVALRVTEQVPPLSLVPTVRFEPRVDPDAQDGIPVDWNLCPIQGLANIGDFCLQLTAVEVICRMCMRPGAPARAMLELMWEHCPPSCEQEASVWLRNLGVVVWIDTCEMAAACEQQFGRDTQ